MLKADVVVLALATAVVGVAGAGDMLRPAAKIDFDRGTGLVKPVNGIGQGPLVGWGDTEMFAFLKEAEDGVQTAAKDETSAARGCANA